MKLYNCETEREIVLKETDLNMLNNEELLNLSRTIKYYYETGILEDESIVINALLEITEELSRRCIACYAVL